jgi:hypothetical protein
LRFNSSSSDLYEGGKPRLAFARELFLNGEDPDLESLLEFYRGWRDLPEYGVIQRQTWNGQDIEKKTIAVKCAKRGNDVYQYRVRRRFGPIERLKKDIEFFSFNESNPIVSVLFVTLTWHGVGSISESWEANSYYFNKWVTNLREKYGKLSYVRTWEATERGYAHVHLMIMFHEARFHGFKTINEEGKVVWRIYEKEEFEKSWPYFVDVRAARTYGAVVRYIRKRVYHGTDKADNVDAGDLTLALMWLFRKRSFAISKDLLKQLSDLIGDLHNSKLQAKLTGGYLEETWVWIGVYSASELGLSGLEWSVVLDSCPVS